MLHRSDSTALAVLGVQIGPSFAPTKAYVSHMLRFDEKSVTDRSKRRWTPVRIDGIGPDFDGDLSLARELDGIADDVDDQLADACSITVHVLRQVRVQKHNHVHIAIAHRQRSQFHR
jgi:hypothetical protein